MMRPARQSRIISLHIECLVNLKNQLENLMNDINSLIEKGDCWLQGSDEFGTFLQINEYLDLGISSCLLKCLNIANEKDVTGQDPSTELDNKETMPGSAYSNDKDKLSKKLKSLKQKQKDTEKYIESIRMNQSAAEMKYNSRFDEVMTELHTASDFIQSQTEIFAEKVKSFEEKCSIECSEILKNIQSELKCNSTNVETLQKTVADIDKKVCDHLTSSEKKLTKDNMADVYGQMVDSETERKETQNYGVYETQVSEAGDEHLHNYFITCKKNPGHTKFIPVDHFTLDHLPVDHQDNDVYEFIKAAADLTVRVDVRVTSPLRPNFWPKTNISFPFYKMRDQTTLRIGSGMVTEVIVYKDGYYDQSGEKVLSNNKTCFCNKCRQSVTPSRMWWEVSVLTAAQVVFDEFEAMHTTLRFFYDNEDSSIVSFDTVNVGSLDTDRDRCELQFVTCDKKQGARLSILLKCFLDARKRIHDKKLDIYRDVGKLNFMISHPHGCYKQISVGQWVKMYVKNYQWEFSYTTCTCPGSTGAPVFCIASAKDHLVHTRSSSSGLNFSGSIYFQNLN